MPVLILTAKGEEADKVRGFRIGADDYVTKPFGVLELLARVEALLRRSRPVVAAGTAAIERFADVEVDRGTRSVHRGGQIVALTPMEFDLLVALIKRNGAVVSRLELLSEVWGHSSAVLTRTVDTHIGELRRKLEADPSMPRHIPTVRKAGWRRGLRHSTEAETQLEPLVDAGELARGHPSKAAAAYEWRPAKSVRSTAETFKHVAADNYFLPAAMGTSAPAGTGIDGKDFKTTGAFEKRTMTRDQIIEELETSFAFLKASMSAMPDARLDAPLDVFGQKMTNRGLWITTTTHLHEHLGQLIAYARSNNVTPPWSK